MSRLDELLQEKKSHYTRRQRATSILLVLSLLVTSAVFYNLRLTGITMAGDAHCGIDEHTHSDECYEYTLICSIPEAEETEPETTETEPPTAADVQETTETEPTEPEPTEAEPTEPAEMNVSEPHKHSEECGCYEKKLTCTRQEHTHDLPCYSDDEADLETPALWESSFASISRENPVDALVEIAKSQVGYQESDANFRTENGEKQGYTRYGAWYGSPYGKWSTMFTAFCLSYAGFTQEETPYAQSSDSMRALWKDKGLYQSKDSYTGQAGDIVFLTENLVGIIYERMPDYIHIIVGDMENRVQKMEISIHAAEVLGYGVLPREENQNPYGLTRLTITASATHLERQTMAAKRLATRSGAQNIKDYIESIGGSFEFSLLNEDKTPITPDENGNITLEPKTEYLVSITMHTGEHGGILPGEYIYNLPDGVITAEDEGEIDTTDGTNIGTWQIDTAGHIKFQFNENTNHLGDVLINVTTGVIFPSDSEMDLDGNIHVTVRPDEEKPEDLLTMTKWGRGVKTDAEGNLVDENGNSYNYHYVPWGEPLFQDGGYQRIYWDVYIRGNKQNSLAGYEITDQILSPNTHFFSPKDMEAGILVRYTGATLNPDEAHWIILKPGTPGLEFTETGFRYTMPQELTCDDPKCSYKNQWINTNNDPIRVEKAWIANLDYFTTLKPATENGENTYSNKIYIADQSDETSLTQTISTANASIQKNGAFNGHTGEFQWLISAYIPRQPAENLTIPWALMDLTKLSLNGGTALDIEGAFYQPVKRMTARIGDTEYEVPYITEITPGEQPPLAYCYGYVSNGPVTSMVMYLLTPCNCTGPENCETWGKVGETAADRERCHSGDIWVGNQLVQRDYGYCCCWNVDNNVRLLIEYTSPGAPVIDRSKNQIGEYINIIDLHQIEFNYDRGWAQPGFVLNATDTAKVPVPSVFDKVLVSDPTKENSYIASYTITINESKVDLTNEESIRIEDTMSNTLVYIPGTLVVQTEDAEGNTGQLVYGEDYTLTVGGSGNRLTIEIFTPQALKYTFYYDCRITVPPGQTSLLFDNAAKITLFGQVFEDEQPPKQVTNVAVSANDYRVNIQKMDADIRANTPLPDAQFGFFAQNGERIVEKFTDETGRLVFETDISKGIVIREHVLYYVQELNAPLGYILDNTKHYMFFCDQSAACEKCAEMAALEQGADALRVQTGHPGFLTLYNQKGVPLFPETGGNGPLLLYILGLSLTISPCIYLICSKRHKRERRLRL